MEHFKRSFIERSFLCIAGMVSLLLLMALYHQLWQFNGDYIWSWLTGEQVCFMNSPDVSSWNELTARIKNHWNFPVNSDIKIFLGQWVWLPIFFLRLFIVVFFYKPVRQSISVFFLRRVPDMKDMKGILENEWIMARWSTGTHSSLSVSVWRLQLRACG